MDALSQQQPPVLEDLDYPGRTGGYVARITGKLINEAAVGGCSQLLFPPAATSTVISAVRDGQCMPLFSVPTEFYTAVRNRVASIFGQADAPHKEVQYDAEFFTLYALPVANSESLTLNIRRSR